MKTCAFALLLVMPVACAAAPSPTQAPPPITSAKSATARDPALQAALAKVAAESDGIVAVTVQHLGNGTRASLRGDVRLPMMSVFKLPLAIVALSLVETGALKLEQDVPIAESELRLGTVSPIADQWKDGARSVTLETLIVRAIQDSDNTAGDKLVTLLGGGAAITTHLRKLGIVGVDVAEQEIEIFARAVCPGTPKPFGGWTMPAINACPTPTPADQLAAGQREIDHAPNGATTDALVEMLAAIDGGAIPRYRSWLRDTLAGTKTGAKRLKALLPPGTRVEHKTGTGEDPQGLNVATNDVGVLTLPDGQRVAIAVLTAGSRRVQAAREATIARLAKVTWDRFVAQ